MSKKRKLPMGELLEGSFDIIQYANAFNEYIGWSIYTGYDTSEGSSKLSSEGYSYIGKWTGLNENSFAPEIKKDIDERIRVLMIAFQRALEAYDNRNPLLEKEFPTNKDALEALSNKYFVVPEFFFHCKEGPYPQVRIRRMDNVLDKKAVYKNGIIVKNATYKEVENKYAPVDYIKKEIEEQFKKCVEQHHEKYATFHTYHLIIGSVMTCNIANYREFFDKKAVISQAKRFAEAYEDKNLQVEIQSYFDNPNLRRFNPNTIRRDYKNIFQKVLADARREPFCTVRNRGLVFFGNPAIQSYAEYKYEKQHQSSIDLPLGSFDSDGELTHGNMITEWMAVHPSYSIIEGDKIGHPDHSFARFNPFGKNIDFDGLIKSLFLKKFRLQREVYDLIKQVFIARNRNFDTGIELCLDHAQKRLRRTVGMTKESGAREDNYPLTVQVVCSAGMSLDEYGLAVEKGGAGFNVDGLTPLLDEQDKEDFNDEYDLEMNDEQLNKAKSHVFIENGKTYKKIFNNVYSMYKNSEWLVDRDEKNEENDSKYYYSHTQLAFALPKSTLLGYNYALGNNNEKARTYETKKGKPRNYLLDHFDSTEIALDDIEYEKKLFAANLGELHHYFPSRGNLPIRRVIGIFDEHEKTVIKTTSSDDEGGIKSIKIYYNIHLSGAPIARSVDQSVSTPTDKYQIYHGQYTEIDYEHYGCHSLEGLEIDYNSGFTQKIGAIYPDYESITIDLNDNQYIDAIYMSYSLQESMIPIQALEFRITNKDDKSKKWTNIFNDIDKEKEEGSPFVDRIIEGRGKPLTLIEGFEEIPTEDNQIYIMRLEFYFGQQEFHAKPFVKEISKTLEEPVFIPTIPKPLKGVRLWSDNDSYTGIQMLHKGKIEGAQIGNCSGTPDEFIFIDEGKARKKDEDGNIYEDRLVGLAVLSTHFNDESTAVNKIKEIRFRIANKVVKKSKKKGKTIPSPVERWSPTFRADWSQEQINQQEVLDDSIEAYQKEAETREQQQQKEQSVEHETYFQYAYAEGESIWKIVPHCRLDSDNVLYLDGLTVKIGWPF